MPLKKPDAVGNENNCEFTFGFDNISDFKAPPGRVAAFIVPVSVAGRARIVHIELWERLFVVFLYATARPLGPGTPG